MEHDEADGVDHEEKVEVHPCTPAKNSAGTAFHLDLDHNLVLVLGLVLGFVLDHDCGTTEAGYDCEWADDPSSVY